jgi:hypothetical protein
MLGKNPNTEKASTQYWEEIVRTEWIRNTLGDGEVQETFHICRFCRFLTVYNTKNHWVFELSSMSGILKKLEITTVLKLDGPIWILRWGSETPVLLGPLERANSNHLTTYISIATTETRKTCKKNCDYTCTNLKLGWRGCKLYAEHQVHKN